MKVTLREKKLKEGKRGLYLDFYPPIIIDGKATRRDHLKLYIHSRPKNEEEREHNKETKILASGIAAQRQLELQAGNYGFYYRRSKKDFIQYVREICAAKKKEKAEATYNFYNAILLQLIAFCGETFLMKDVTEKFCNDFKDHLEYRAGLARNSASNYFNIFRSIVNGCADNNLLPTSPAKKCKGIQAEETHREFLTFEELKALAETDFENDDLKRAALFSALTGLRFSDIHKLIWSEIHHSEKQGFYIRFRLKKTKTEETLPISNEAAELLGERAADNEKVFINLKVWHRTMHLPLWVTKAGIKRKITFHSFRHTFATLQLTFGTDLYTVSKMLGHKDISTTQIYAKIINESKRQAAEKISLKS